MSKTKKYLLLAVGILMVVWAAAAGYFVVRVLADMKLLNALTNELNGLFGLKGAELLEVLKYFVAYMSANAVLSLGFGLFAIRFSFLSSDEFYNKQTIISTMSVISVIVVNPIIAAVFIVAAFMPDRNYVPAKQEDLALNMLEEKLQKLVSLRDKNLITEEEFVDLRAKLLSGK